MSKKFKTIDIILIAAIVLVTALFGFLIATSLGSAGKTPSGPSTSGPSTDPDNPKASEKKIVKTATLADLKRKIAVLHGAAHTNYNAPAFQVSDASPLMPYGVVNDQIRLMMIIDSYNTGSTPPARISALRVASDYFDIFGRYPEHQDINPGGCYYEYRYDAAEGLYIRPEDLSCSTSSESTHFFYKTDFTQSDSGDEAYVYLRGATRWDERSGLCRIYNRLVFAADLAKARYDSAMHYGSCTKNFSLNSDNFEDFAEYRFIFLRHDDGNTYYFDSVSRMSV